MGDVGKNTEQKMTKGQLEFMVGTEAAARRLGLRNWAVSLVVRQDDGTLLHAGYWDPENARMGAVLSGQPDPGPGEAEQRPWGVPASMEPARGSSVTVSPPLAVEVHLASGAKVCLEPGDTLEVAPLAVIGARDRL